MNYKKGNYVKIKRDGRIGKIAEVYEDGNYSIEVDGVLVKDYVKSLLVRQDYDAQYDTWRDSDLEPAPKTWETLEVGDILANIGGNKIKVLSVSDSLITRSAVDDFDIAYSSFYTKQELINGGWTVYQQPTPEPILELTLDEIAKKYGRDVKDIKIKK